MQKIKIIFIFDKKGVRIKEPTKAIALEFDTEAEKNTYIQGFCDAEKAVGKKYGSGHDLDYYILSPEDAEFENWENAVEDGEKTRKILNNRYDSLTREFCGPIGYY